MSDGWLKEFMLTNLPVPYDLCISNPISHLTMGIRPFSKCLNRFLNVKCDYENFAKVRFQLYYVTPALGLCSRPPLQWTLGFYEQRFLITNYCQGEKPRVL